MVAPAADMTSHPTAELPVKLTMSMRGSVVSSLAASTPDGVTTFTTPGGMSVYSLIIRASASPASGVNGDGLSTTVFPAASALLTFITFRQCGKFHGVRIDTTPSGSCRSSVVPAPIPVTGRSASCAASWAARIDMYAVPSICITRSLVMQPHSSCDSAKNSSACLASASPSWFRQRARPSGPMPDHGPSSNARRAAAIASPTWATLALGAVPMACSVAGEMSS